ncbi:MAG: rhodanese-like domain-containing protein [Campylobacterota bacterium]|nr:rhodanese-like domain-containing protein [Campylobacterota bacterium]
MKRMGDGLSLILLAFAGLFFLYQKGYILADFERVSVSQAYELLKSEPNGIVLLDVRTQEEYAHDGKIKGSVLIPLGDLEKNLSKIEKSRDKKILVYCRSGNRSISASRILKKHGFNPYNVDDGINQWKKEGLPSL